MKRPYKSQRRAESKARTIQDILEAALRLHGRGVTELNAIAREAAVSPATVRKYFPTREDLFRGCTSHFLRSHEPPSLESLARVADPGERLLRVTSQVYAFHEMAFGPSWLAHRLQEESPAMAQVVAATESFVRAAAEVAFRDWNGGTSAADREAAIGFARGLLSPLTYRALRLTGGLDPQTAAKQAALALSRLVGIVLPAPEA